MEKTFSSHDAKKLVEEHKKILQVLADSVVKREQYLSEISSTIEKLVDKTAYDTIKNIPVEELNRGKKGIRVKALRDAGYESIADIVTTSVHNISNIYGVSEDGAYLIMSVAKNIADQARKDIKVKINADRKNRLTTELVQKISKYKENEPYIVDCQNLYKTMKMAIEDKMVKVKPATGGIRWFFASNTKKEEALKQCTVLKNLLDNGYGVQVYHNQTKIQENERISADAAWENFGRDSIRFFHIIETIAPGVLGKSDDKYGLPEDLAVEIQQECFFPDGLLCQLRRYQEWGVKYILHQERVLLGDEMGLGKTIQAIAAMVSLKNTGATHFCVVCPASVLTNWCREIKKHSTLSVIKVHGYDRETSIRQWIKYGGVAVTTYETTAFIEFSAEFKFSMLIVDEAHYIKNPNANRTKNVKNIGSHAERLLYMTGTAIENKVEEMVGLIHYLQPGVAKEVKGMEALVSAPQFRTKVAPVYYRRKREDVLTELPELIETKEWCTMTSVERKVYESAVLNKEYSNSRRVSWNVPDLSYSSKAQRLMEIIDEAEKEGRKIIVFSFFLDTIRKISSMLGERCLQPINGSVSVQRRQEIIDEFENAPAGTVLATQILAGGTGLNIQVASVVVICEPQFKPSIENQAISRAYRMGQTRNVLVYRLLCEDSVDERITNLLENKQKIFDAFADKSVAAQESIELDKKSFGNIIQEEIEKINSRNNKNPFN